MCSKYDENLNENVFFKTLTTEYKNILKRAVLEKWLICIPCSESLLDYEVNFGNILNHILVPSQELPETHYETLYKTQVIFGPMFSGKTTELIRRLKRYQVANYRCLIVRYAKDSRYSDDAIVAHDGQMLNAVSAVKLCELIPTVHNFDVIGVDEGQFFEDVVNFAESMANDGKIVIVAALDATFQRTPFGNILNLIPIAESVVKLMAVCMSCFNDGSFTKRKTDEKEWCANGTVRVDKFGVELIGGAEKYMSVCRQCYNLGNTTKNSPYKVTNENYENNSKPIVNGKRLKNGF